ncbi:C-Jun-amino-terminal kinase-interacting protein 4-like isoform X2 [Halichondria panicea]|uniref:C-Jun-amino-terminal kinase-interacting protein 4-like isoform X2 n=1 Tax=Halichondria panicea TaxID=6063 RepID=UPI00312BB173
MSLSDAEIIEEEDEGHVVSERVQTLAKGIYDELQSLVEQFGGESIGNIMPLVVNVLENLDSSLSDNQDHLTALDELNEENQQLSKQYQREKQRRKEAEEKTMRLEDVSELEARELKDKLSRLSQDNRNFELKFKSQKEQIDRLEDRCESFKKESSDLHNRNIDLVKKHQVLKKESTLKRDRSDSRTKSTDEVPASPLTNRAPGFQDFMSPQQDSKKKRQLPIAPRRRPRAESADEDIMFLGTTPANRPDSPEYMPRGGGGGWESEHLANQMSLYDEAARKDAESDDTLDDEPEDLYQPGEEDFDPNEENLLAELHLATSGSNAPGVDQIIIDNEKLMLEKSELSLEMDHLLAQMRELELDKATAESSASALQEQKNSVSARVTELEVEVRKLRKDLEEEQEKPSVIPGDVSGERLSRLEVARVLRERNEYKEKYLSLLEQIRMSDELALFKSKGKKSKWLDYFAAIFSPAKRREMEKSFDGTPRRPIMSGQSPSAANDTDGGGFPHAVGYRNTEIIPVLRKTGRRQDEMYMTSVSWVIPALDHQSEKEVVQTTPTTPSINTCRPMSHQEDGAKVLCAAAVNPAVFLFDHQHAIKIRKETSPGPNGGRKERRSNGGDQEASISLVWVVTGVPNLTKVSVLDVAAVGEVVETFPVCASPIQCITSVPGFDENDPDVIADLSTARRKVPPQEVQNTLNTRPSSKLATMWMGSDTGVLYVHSAVSLWNKCIHADKLPAGIQDIVHLKGKVYVLLQNAKMVVFRRFPDGDWDWDNYSIVLLSQHKDLPCTALAAVHFNVWCAVGNSIHVVHSHLFKMEATIPVHQNKRAEVTQMVAVGDGVWLSFKYDSILRLFHAATYTHIQDLDVAPSVQRVLVFGSEKRSSQMPIQISTIVPAHNSLWVGTENGVLLTYPFTAPTLVAEETGWELIKEAEVKGRVVPEPFDLKMEHAVEAGEVGEVAGPLEESTDSSKLSTAGSQSTRSSESPLPPSKLKHTTQTRKPFNPFCNVDQVQISIHCHINAVRSMVCVPGIVPKDVAMYEPLGGVFIGSGDSKTKPALFIVSCGEGHLDLRTADKVLQTLQAKETGQTGLPSPASILSDKNYIMVWDINS